MTSSWDDEAQGPEGQNEKGRQRLIFRWAVLAVVVILGVVWLWGGQGAPTGDGPVAAGAWYRCTMPVCNDPGSADPESRCPVCGMKRELVTPGVVDHDHQAVGAAPDVIRVGPRARHLAEVEVEPVQRRALIRRIRGLGQLAVDERRVSTLESRLSGVVERVAADFTGLTVRKGDHLVEIYSRELLLAQNELLRLLWGFGRIQGRGRNRSVDQDLVTVRHELEILGMTPQEIDQMIEKDHEDPHIIVKAPFHGTILAKGVTAGMFVETGDLLYEIADLSELWILVDVFEDDFPWVHLGQEVFVEARSLPGESFQGRVSFVDPVVDPSDRTFRVRAEVPNPGLRLKPGTFVTAHLEAFVAADGDLGDGTPDDLPLSVPREAILDTGERAIVYLEREEGAYQGVEVSLGPLSEDSSGRQFYPVVEGVAVNDMVVTRGAFAIDSQRQISAPAAIAGQGAGPRREQASAEVGEAPPSPHGAMKPPEQPLRLASRAETRDTTQTHCPVLGNPIDPSVYVDYRGVRIYFCCHLCTPKFVAEPEKYLPNLPEGLQQRIREWRGGTSTPEHHD